MELAYGQGIVVATVLADPTIEASERKIYATLTKRLIVQGSGFSLDGTELTLRPTSRSSYEVESVEMAEMVLILKEGKSWAPAKTKDDGKPVSIYVTKIDTGAGEVVMEDDGAIVARVFPDPSGAVCDDPASGPSMACVTMGPPVKIGRSSTTIMGASTAMMTITTAGMATTTMAMATTTTTSWRRFARRALDCTGLAGEADPDAPDRRSARTACQWASDDYCSSRVSVYLRLDAVAATRSRASHCDAAAAAASGSRGVASCYSVARVRTLVRTASRRRR